MTRIPIHDATAPVACTADRDELAGRVEQLERMRRELIRLERSEHGLLLHFPDRPEIDAELRAFAADEKACCAFWGFAVTTNAGDDHDGHDGHDGHDRERTLRWDGPPSVALLFDRLVEFFEGDGPLTALDGLL